MKIYFFIFGHAGSSLLCGLSLVVAGGGCSLAAMLQLLTAVLRLLTAVLRLLTAVLRLLTAVLRFSPRCSGFSRRCSASHRGAPLLTAVLRLLTAVLRLLTAVLWLLTAVLRFSPRWLLLLRSMGAQASVAVVHGLSCLATREIFLGQGSNLCPLHWQVDS